MVSCPTWTKNLKWYLIRASKDILYSSHCLGIIVDRVLTKQLWNDLTFHRSNYLENSQENLFLCGTLIKYVPHDPEKLSLFWPPFWWDVKFLVLFSLGLIFIRSFYFSIFPHLYKVITCRTRFCTIDSSYILMQISCQNDPRIYDHILFYNFSNTLWHFAWETLLISAHRCV